MWQYEFMDILRCPLVDGSDRVAFSCSLAYLLAKKKCCCYRGSVTSVSKATFAIATLTFFRKNFSFPDHWGPIHVLYFLERDRNAAEVGEWLLYRSFSFGPFMTADVA